MKKEQEEGGEEKEKKKGKMRERKKEGKEGERKKKNLAREFVLDVKRSRPYKRDYGFREKRLLVCLPKGI